MDLLTLIFSFSASPPSTTYAHPDFKSDLQIGKPGTANTSSKANVYSMGIGRHHYDRVYLPHRKANIDPSAQPGPGTYDVSQFNVGRQGRKHGL